MNFKVDPLLIKVWHLTIGAITILSLTNCGSEDAAQTPSLLIPPSKVGNHFQAYVETSMGSYKRLTYNLSRGKLDTILLESEPILPLPVNVGFVPFGDTDQIDKVNTWILSKRLQTGDTLGILPIGLIKYEINGREHVDVFAVPIDEERVSVPITHFRDLIIGYDPVKFNFEYWLRHQGDRKLTQLSWQDEGMALEYLNSKLN